MQSDGGWTYMPKQTFFNLPPEKRQIIEQAALDEFSKNGFDNAVLNRIVEKSKIAKGSYYQYFDDIKDLYFHLIDTLINKKAQYFEPVLNKYKNHSLSHNLAELFRLLLEFSENNPKLHKLDIDYAANPQHLNREYSEKYKPQTQDIYTLFLAQAQVRGELYIDLNLSLASFFIASLIDRTVIFILNQSGGKKQKQQIADEMLSFIERAVLNKKNYRE